MLPRPPEKMRCCGSASPLVITAMIRTAGTLPPAEQPYLSSCLVFATSMQRTAGIIIPPRVPQAHRTLQPAPGCRRLARRSFTLVATPATPKKRPSAEHTGNQHTAPRPRPKQNAVDFGLGKPPLCWHVVASPDWILRAALCSCQRNDPPYKPAAFAEALYASATRPRSDVACRSVPCG